METKTGQVGSSFDSFYKAARAVGREVKLELV